jgi:hypothetical protein
MLSKHSVAIRPPTKRDRVPVVVLPTITVWVDPCERHTHVRAEHTASE